jgi:hypothetical protein
MGCPFEALLGDVASGAINANKAIVDTATLFPALKNNLEQIG